MVSEWSSFLSQQEVSVTAQTRQHSQPTITITRTDHESGTSSQSSSQRRATLGSNESLQNGSNTSKLEGINFSIKSGEYLSIMGLGLRKIHPVQHDRRTGQTHHGRVFIDEVDVAQLDAYELAWLRCRKIGYIFQTFNLIQVMTAIENVTIPYLRGHEPRIHGKRNGSPPVGRTGGALPSQAFGALGRQQQRVAVARALANDPAIILRTSPRNLDLTRGRKSSPPQASVHREIRDH